MQAENANGSDTLAQEWYQHTVISKLSNIVSLQWCPQTTYHIFKYGRTSCFRLLKHYNSYPRVFFLAWARVYLLPQVIPPPPPGCNAIPLNRYTHDTVCCHTKATNFVDKYRQNLIIACIGETGYWQLFIIFQPSLAFLRVTRTGLQVMQSPNCGF